MYDERGVTVSYEAVSALPVNVGIKTRNIKVVSFCSLTFTFFV